MGMKLSAIVNKYTRWTSPNLRVPSAQAGLCRELLRDAGRPFGNWGTQPSPFGQKIWSVQTYLAGLLSAVLGGESEPDGPSSAAIADLRHREQQLPDGLPRPPPHIGRQLPGLGCQEDFHTADRQHPLA